MRPKGTRDEISMMGDDCIEYLGDGVGDNESPYPYGLCCMGLLTLGQVCCVMYLYLCKEYSICMIYRSAILLIAKLAFVHARQR